MAVLLILKTLVDPMAATPVSVQPAKEKSSDNGRRALDRRDRRIKIKLHPGQQITAEKLRLQSLEFLGKGGSGSVFRMMVTDGSLRGLFVAVKFLETVQDEKRVARFAKRLRFYKNWITLTLSRF